MRFSLAIQTPQIFNVSNTLLRIIFLTLFSVFGYPNEMLSFVFDILHGYTENVFCF